MQRFYLVLTILSLFASIAITSPAAASQIGKQINDFKLPSHRGRVFSLSDFQDQKIVVVAFLGTECPLAKLYGRRLAELAASFESAEVAFIGVNSNTQDSLTEMTAYADRYGIKFPLLKDLENQVADAMKATRTPEVFVLDRERKVRYHGRIDDQYLVGLSRDKAQRNDLSLAIKELLDGKKVSVPETEVIGCHIGRVKRLKPTGDVTYTKHIAPILNKRCVECHRDGEIAPFTLTSYEDVLGWEETILEVIADNRMPPWFANPDHGTFRNDARLSSEERELIEQWVDNGMPEGDPKDLPPAPEFASGWRIPQPDQIFHMKEEPFEVPADGVVDYKHFIVDPKWGTDKYVYAAEARPDNASVVHHILVYILPEGERRPNLRSVLVGYAPGSTPVHHTDGVAIHVPAGSKLLFQMHYTPNGYAQKDRSYAGVCFIDKRDVTRLRKRRIAADPKLKIPPNADNHKVEAMYTVGQDEMLLSMTPHMHLRGKSFKYDAYFPDGQTETLLDVPRYDFNWQLKYILSEPMLLPKGTVIHCTAFYDNSSDNLVNPNPDETVSWGDQSSEEMMIGFLDTVPVAKFSEKKLSTRVDIDPSGKWTWESRLDGGVRKLTMTLKLTDQVLTGKIQAADRTVNVQDALVEGDRLTFATDFGPLTFNFDAKISKDKLEGSVSFDALNQTRTLPWNAKRVGNRTGE